MRRSEQEPLAEPALEVPRDPESGEDAAERCGLEQDEDELEGRVAWLEVEARNLAQLGETARRTR